MEEKPEELGTKDTIFPEPDELSPIEGFVFDQSYIDDELLPVKEIIVVATPTQTS